MEFTHEEIERINQLYGNDFKDITPNDAALIGRWESYKAVKNTELQAQLTAIKEVSQARIAASKEQAENSKTALQELKEAALYRLEVIENGQK